MPITTKKPRRFMRGIITNNFLLAPDIVKTYMLSVNKHMRKKV